jgi:hypothetical protein
MTSPSLQKFKRWAALLRAERNSLGHSLESFAMDWEADLSASREDRRHEPAAGEAQPLTDARQALEKIVSAYDAYRRRGVAPAPVEYADFTRMIDVVGRAALATHPAPAEPALEETRRAVAAIAVVGQVDGHDVVRRLSVLDIIDRRRADPAPSAAPAQPVTQLHQPTAEWARDGIATFVADHWADRKHTLAEIEAGIRAIEIRVPPAPPAAQPVVPIPMLLHCPRCGTQHVDAVESTLAWTGGAVPEPSHDEVTWDNPPHRSHLCHHCGCIWRPADVPTTGVKAIATKGKADTWDQGFADRVLGALAAAPSAALVDAKQPLGDAASGPGSTSLRSSDPYRDLPTSER